MGLRIRTNVASINAQRNLKVNTQGVGQAMERLSSGYRINKAMDDVAGLAISEGMQAQIRGSKQAERNAQTGISFIQVAEGGLNESTNILVRMRELATQAASDTIGDSERGFLNTEVQQLKTEMDRIAQTTEFSGRKLLDGSGGTMDFQVGLHSSEHDRITFDASQANAFTGNLGVDGVSVSSKESARDSLELFDNAMNKIGNLRANFGALQSRMNSSISNLDVYTENLSSAQSRIRDADLGEESSNLAKATVLQNAATTVLAHANMSNNLALRLLE